MARAQVGGPTARASHTYCPLPPGEGSQCPTPDGSPRPPATRKGTCLLLTAVHAGLLPQPLLAGRKEVPGTDLTHGTPKGLRPHRALHTSPVAWLGSVTGCHAHLHENTDGSGRVLPVGTSHCLHRPSLGFASRGIVSLLFPAAHTCRREMTAPLGASGMGTDTPLCAATAANAFHLAGGAHGEVGTPRSCELCSHPAVSGSPES